MKKIIIMLAAAIFVIGGIFPLVSLKVDAATASARRPFPTPTPEAKAEDKDDADDDELSTPTPTPAPSPARTPAPTPKPTVANALTVDEILEKHINAMGGRDKLLSLKTVRGTGTIIIQNYDVGFIVTKKHLVGIRTDTSVMTTNNYEIVTPTGGIAFMPIKGETEPTQMPDRDLKAKQTQLDIQSPFLDYRKKGNVVELIGTEKIDGTDCYKLKVTFNNGLVTTYFINKTNYRIARIVAIRNINGQDVDVWTRFSDYRQNKDGYWFAYTIGSFQGETNFEMIETNIPVDDSIFRMP